jgi:iron(III) transport system ATP-binding protein
VLDVRPHGAHDLVRIAAEGVVWRALAPARTPLGETVDVQIQPAGAFAFAAS